MKLQAKKLPTFLLVTQEPLTRAFFENVVDKLEDHALICSQSAADALDDLGRHFISLIIIDDKVPYIELAPLCENIRALHEYEHTPILIITGHLKKTFTRMMLKAGATDFLTEPLDEDEFLVRMEMAKEVKQTHQKISALTTLFGEMTTTVSSLEKRTILDDRAVRMIGSALQEKNNLAMLMLEIDQFTKFEHARGEKAGHALLIDFADHLQNLMRKQDLFFCQKKGRYIVLLPKTSSRAAEFIAENIQESLDAETFSAGGIRFNLTVSIGLVTLDEDGSNTKSASFNLDRLMQTAQTCLNEAKKKGNTIISHSP